MAEEEKTQSQQETTQESASDTETSGTEKTETPDYEKQYKDTQAELTKASQELSEQKQFVDTISPYVDWGKVQGGEEKPSEEESGYIDRKAYAEGLKELSGNIDIKLLALGFRQAHPELKPYEETITGPALARLRRQHPRESIEKVMDRAAKFTTELLEQERNKGAEDAEKKKQEAAAVGGLDSAGPTSPKEEKPLGETGADYIARRKAQSRKSRGL